MRERMALFGAFVISAVALGALKVLSGRANTLAPRVIRQTIVPATGERMAQIEIDIEPSPAILRFAKEGETWEYRIAESGGRIYSVTSNCDENTHRLFVPLAYGRPPRPARLEFWLDAECQGTIPLAPLPPPRLTTMTTDSPSRLRAFHVPLTEAGSTDPTAGPNGALRFAPTKPLSPGEFWSIQVLRVPAEPALSGVYAGLYLASPNAAVARVLFADDVTAVRVRVSRGRHRTKIQQVVVSGLRLVDRGGQTALAWGGTDIPNSLGLELRRAPNDRGLGYVDPLVHGDQRSAALRFENGGAPRKAEMELQGLTGQTPGSEERNLTAQIEMEFVKPDFRRLDVRRLEIGGATWSTTDAPLGPIDRKPFGATLKISRSWNEPLETFETTIPVESKS